MEIYMVSLADRLTNQDQRILVTVPATDSEAEIRDFVMSRPTGTKGEQITLADPVIIGMRKLAIKRPHATNFPNLIKAVV